MDKKEKRIRILSPGEGLYKELGSSFESAIFPIESLEEMKTREESFRKAHPKADHYPYAAILGDYAKSSDDGEPGGTCGRPMLSLLSDHGIDGAILLVARYFGGTKLGVGRLRRAFLESCADALSHARFGIERQRLVYDLSLDYPTYERIKGLGQRGEFDLVDVEFGINVNLSLRCGDKIDALLEKKGVRIDLPSPRQVTIIEEVEHL